MNTVDIESKFEDTTKCKELTGAMDLIKQNKELWDLFTRKEEYNPILLDCYERFPHYICCNRTIFKPEVSKFLIDNGFKIEYPENRRFAVCLTHDIDGVQFSNISILTGAARSLYHFQIKDALKRPFYKIDKRWNPL